MKECIVIQPINIISQTFHSRLITKFKIIITQVTIRLIPSPPLYPWTLTNFDPHEITFIFNDGQALLLDNTDYTFLATILVIVHNIGQCRHGCIFREAICDFHFSSVQWDTSRSERSAHAASNAYKCTTLFTRPPVNGEKIALKTLATYVISSLWLLSGADVQNDRAINKNENTSDLRVHPPAVMSIRFYKVV